MNGLVFAIAAVVGAIALTALWYLIRLGREVKRLRRNEYYTDQKLKSVTMQIADALEPIRIQLTKIATGHPVPEELIRRGRLYYDISAEEAEQIISKDAAAESKRFLVVDVRTAREYAVRHVPGAKLIPIEEIEGRYRDEIPSTLEKVFVYCAGGDRSRLACDFLSRQGYLNLYNVRDGLQRWKGPTTGKQAENLIQIQSKSKLSSLSKS